MNSLLRQKIETVNPDFNIIGRRSWIKRRAIADRRKFEYAIVLPERRQTIRRCVADRRNLLKENYK